MTKVWNAFLDWPSQPARAIRFGVLGVFFVAALGLVG